MQDFLKHYRRAFIPALLLMALLSSCYWDNEETLYGSTDTTCDTSAITYSGNIAPLLDYNCNSCHSTSDASALGGNIVLDQYSILVKYANNGSLLGSIQHKSGYEAMPKSASKLTSCEIATVKAWIDNGANND